MRLPLSIAVALLAGAQRAGAQLPEHGLPARPAAVAEEPFSELRSVREVSDGRVIALAMRDQTIEGIDFSSRDADSGTPRRDRNGRVRLLLAAAGL